MRCLKRRLGEAGLQEVLELLADLYLLQADPDPEHPVLTAHQARHRRRRELPLTRDPPAPDLTARLEAAAEVEAVLAEAGLTREERAVLILGSEVGDATIGLALSLSARTVRRRRVTGREKIRAAEARTQASRARLLRAAP